MQIARIAGSLGVAVMTAMMVSAAEPAAPEKRPQPIRVVGLEDEVPEKPAGSKAVSADDLTSRADGVADAKSNQVNVKSLTLEGMVCPPSAEQARTLEEAIREILLQANKQVGAVSSNGIDKLTMPYQQLGDGKSYEIEWRKALRILLSPHHYNFTEDDDLVLLGLEDEVDAKHQQLGQERLASNRTPIVFTTNESEGGMELRNAIREVAVKANVTITTDYMDPADLFVPTMTPGAEGKLSADEIGKAKSKSAAQPVKIKRTSFDTNDQPIEWRIVLREILNPFGYDFVEVGGVVRIAKFEKLKQWEKDAVAAKPLAAKVIRLYHADPEQVVERVMKIKGILMHPNASLQATRKKDDNAETLKNLNSRIQTSSGQKSGMSDTTSQIFDKLVRPRTVPAVIAYDIEENIPVIESKIKLFDIKEKQILIEALLFQLDTNNGSGDMDGIKWEGFEDFVPIYGQAGTIASVTKNLLDKAQLDAAVAEGVSSVDISDGFKFTGSKELYMKSGKFDFKSTIQLIRQRQNSKVLASPMLVVGDHSEAAIQVSDVMPIPQVDASSVAGAAGSAIQNSLNIQWNMLRSGILMWVSPEITEKGTSVRLSVHPQVVTRGNKVDLSSIDTAGNKFKEYPVYNYELKMHEMDTRATVPSGATLMFGGLIDNSEEEVETKVRWLGDIPILGWLFRSKNKVMIQKNLIVMIRPTILEDTDTTGFETNALKATESVMVNSGRDLKATPIGGPNTYKEIKDNVKELYQDRVVKPFEEDYPFKSEDPIPVDEVPPTEAYAPYAPSPVAELAATNAPVARPAE